MPASKPTARRPDVRPRARRAAHAEAVPPDDAQGARADTLTDQVYQQLRQSLMTGALLPEQVLTVRGVAESQGDADAQLIRVDLIRSVKSPANS